MSFECTLNYNSFSGGNLKIRPLFFSLAVTALFAFGAPALFGQAQNASPKPKPQAQTPSST